MRRQYNTSFTTHTTAPCIHATHTHTHLLNSVDQQHDELMVFMKQQANSEVAWNGEREGQKERNEGGGAEEEE